MENVNKISKITIMLFVVVMVLIGTLSQSNAATVEQNTWNYFRSVGCTKEVTAGIMGNIRQESNFKPSHNIAGNYGLYNINQGYYYKLKKYAKKYNVSWKQSKIQNMFMNNTLGPVYFKTYTGKVYKYSNGVKTWWPQKMTWKQFKKIRNVSKATIIFERVCERSGIPNHSRRILFAKKYYNKYK